MNGITDADREAAKALREALADISGFWFRPGDDNPLVAALARHRIEAEQRLADKLAPFLADSPRSDPRRPAARDAETRRPAKGDKLYGPFVIRP